jgi:2-hydroxymuconate-semialdehyde hydrolase
MDRPVGPPRPGFFSRRLVRWFLALGLLALAPWILAPRWTFGTARRLVLKAAGIEEKILDGPETSIRYLEAGAGNGRTVLLLHGLGGDAISTWIRLIPDLAERHHVLVPDLLCSRLPVLDPATYTIDSEVALVKALMAEAESSQVDVVGLSVGGWVALLLALDAPQRIGRLVLVDSAGLAMDPPKFLREPVKTRAEARRLVSLYFHSPPPMPWFVLDQIVKSAQRDGPAFARVFDAFVKNSLPRVLDGKLDKIAHRTLVMHGRQDQVIPLDLGRRIAQGLPNSRLVVLERSGHAAVWDSAARLEREILRFLTP